MDEGLFRIVVTVAVVVASLAFIVQAGIMLALFKVTRKAQENAERFTGKLEPVMAKVEPLIDHAAIAFEKAGPAIERLGPVIQKAGPVIDKIGPVIDKIGPVLDAAVPLIRRAGPVVDDIRGVIAKTSEFVERATDVAATTNLVIEDARPHVAMIAKETSEITRVGREQVERLGDVLTEAGEKARARLEQIDHSVESTIEQVEHVSGAMKRAVMKPVREVNGLAAGISAAVSTLVRGQRKSSVDSATQDEEMFI
jgi:hypothetical protein